MERDVQVHVKCPRCGYEFDEECTVEIEPPEYDEP